MRVRACGPRLGRMPRKSSERVACMGGPANPAPRVCSSVMFLSRCGHGREWRISESGTREVRVVAIYTYIGRLPVVKQIREFVCKLSILKL